MRLSKLQTAVIVFLNIVIAVLLSVIFFVPKLRTEAAGVRDEQDPPSVDINGQPEPEHNKLRPASSGAVPEIARETRLMGSGDETAIDVYFRSGVSYIFGNATVKDYDFDSYGGFLCMVNAAGTILSYTYFDGKMGAVGIVANGYAVGAGESLYYVDYTGAAEIKAELDGPAVDILTVDNNRIAAVTQPTDKSLKLTEYSTVGKEWTADAATRIDNGYALRFYDCYRLDESYVIAARSFYLPKYDAAVFFSFVPGGDPTEHRYGGSGDKMTRPYAIMPCEGGYFAIAAINGMATIITVDSKFISYHSVALGFGFTDASLTFADDKYYASFDKQDGAVTYELKSDLSRKKLNSVAGIYVDCAFKAGNIMLTGTESSGGEAPGKAVIADPYNAKFTRLDIKGAVFYGGFTNTDGLTLVLGATGGDALSKPTGGRDIYIVTLASEQ